MVVNEMGYLTLLLAPFGPAAALGRPVGFEVEAPGDLDAAIAALAGTFRVTVPAAVCPEQGVDVSVAKLADFRPAGIAQNCPYLRRILEAQALCDQAVHSGTPLATLRETLRNTYGDLPLDLALPATTDPPVAKASGGATIDAILDMMATEESRPVGTAGAAAWARALAGLASSVLGSILADPVFRAAEVAWRGVRLILQHAGPKSVLTLRLVSADAEALPGVLTQLAQSPPKAPPNLILVDAFLDAAPARQDTWNALAEAADTLLAPTAVALAPAFFHLDDWEGLSRIGYPARALDEAAFAKWRKLATEPGGAWLGALFLRAALRPAYGPENPARVAPLTEAEPLWGSPIWLLGAAVAASLARSGWPHRFELGQGVAIGDLAVTVAGSRAMAVEVLLSDDRLLDFAKVGLTPLAGKSGSDQAFFRHATTLDGVPFPVRLLLNRALGFFFRCREDATLDAILTEAGAEALAAALRDRFARFFQATGHHAPADLNIDAASAANGARLSIGFTPPADLASSSGRLEFSFIW
ncbi:MAG: type VI secretion system contractile sheath large subunit [Solidesulfovibrio sp.]